MTDYSELVNALRELHKNQDCNECEAGNIGGWCDESACVFLDAAAAIEELQGWMTSARDVVEAAYQHGFIDGQVGAKIPKHGEWYKPNGWTSKTYKRLCTNCLNVAYFCGTGDYKFCPNCGAKMGVQG